MDTRVGTSQRVATAERYVRIELVVTAVTVVRVSILFESVRSAEYAATSARGGEKNEK